MDQDKILNKLKNLLSNTNGDYKILEEQIDVNLQLEFFEFNSKILKEKTNINVQKEIENLFNDATSLESKKIILARLSNTENPVAYRAIEKYINSGDIKLKNWSILALHHCRISLESHLLDEQQVFISTGLGGKGKKLRYYIVCKFSQEEIIPDTQKKVIKTEFDFLFKNNNAEIEEIQFFDKYFSVLGLVPINKSINEIIKEAINESNNYGGFLQDHYLVTNVKILDINEIKKYFKNKETK